MADYDLKAILGEKIKRLTDKTLKALVDCMCTVGASLCSLDKRVSALENVELPEGGYKPMQEPVASPSASGTDIQFIESASQDAAGRMTITKKTVRTGDGSDTGVVKLSDSTSSTSGVSGGVAATPAAVKAAYDLASGKADPASVVDSASYDSASHTIVFKHGSTQLFTLDAAAFVKDGMVDSVAIVNGNLVITFNTDAGKQPISIPLTDIFNPDNYYTKTDTDALLADKAELVDVTNYTSFSDITAVIQSGNIPYYVHAVGLGGTRLYHQGTSVSGGVPPTVSLVFAGVFDGIVYETRFVNGASAFSAVVETPIFSTDRVIGTGDTSSWYYDDFNVPTRGAVDLKITAAISGSVGGYLGKFAVAYINWWISQGRPPLTFRLGDWFTTTDSGTISYKVNNTGSSATIDVSEGDDVYWTSEGRLVVKPQNFFKALSVSNLEDWNTLNLTGVYLIESQASNVLNGPGEGSGGRIVCYVSVTNGRIIQLAIAGRVWRRQSSNDGGFSNSSWEQLAFASQVDTYVAKTGVYNASTNPFALKDYVDALSTNIPKSRLDQNVQNSLTRADNALTGDPLGITNGSGVTSAYRGAIVFILFANSDFVVHGSGGPVISGATVGGKLCVNPKWLVEYKINAGDRKNHQMYAVLNASGSDFVLTKGVDSSSAGAADHVLVKNEKIEFFGCYGGSSTLQNSDYYLINY